MLVVSVSAINPCRVYVFYQCLSCLCLPSILVVSVSTVDAYRICVCCQSVSRLCLLSSLVLSVSAVNPCRFCVSSCQTLLCLCLLLIRDVSVSAINACCVCVCYQVVSPSRNFWCAQNLEIVRGLKLLSCFPQPKGCIEIGVEKLFTSSFRKPSITLKRRREVCTKALKNAVNSKVCRKCINPFVLQIEPVGNEHGSAAGLGCANCAPECNQEQDVYHLRIALLFFWFDTFAASRGCAEECSFGLSKASSAKSAALQIKQSTSSKYGSTNEVLHNPWKSMFYKIWISCTIFQMWKPIKNKAATLGKFLRLVRDPLNIYSSIIFQKDLVCLETSRFLQNPIISCRCTRSNWSRYSMAIFNVCTWHNAIYVNTEMQWILCVNVGFRSDCFISGNNAIWIGRNRQCYCTRTMSHISDSWTLDEGDNHTERKGQ